MPLGVNRTWVKYIEKGTWPDTKRFFTVLRCNHCADAPCVEICPTSALFRRDDGIVDFDTDRCIGCKACMQACPYDALYVDPDDNTAQKCNYCVHRVEVGLEPACVVVCPEQAIIAGDLHDPASEIARLVSTTQVFARTPEQGTRPNLFYKGVDTAGIDPLAAGVLSDGGMWRDPPPTAGSFMTVDLTPRPGGGRGATNGPTTVSDAGTPPRVVYNTDHPMPWGWRVSSYFLTKGVSAGLALALAVAVVAGADLDTAWARWLTPLLAGLFLVLTGLVLVADLKRPDRFHFLLTKGNPGSWLVRGAWILAGYASLLALWFLAGVSNADSLMLVAFWVSIPFAIATAGYTAFLLGQAEGRDLWQSPTLFWHMVAAGLSLGGAVGLIAFQVIEAGPEAETGFAWSMAIGATALGLLALFEGGSRHATRNVAAAMHHLTRGAYALEWWAGGIGLGVLLPIAASLVTLVAGPEASWVGAIGGIAAIAGVWLADDAFVKAGQSVPLS